MAGCFARWQRDLLVYAGAMILPSIFHHRRKPLHLRSVTQAGTGGSSAWTGRVQVMTFSVLCIAIVICSAGWADPVTVVIDSPGDGSTALLGQKS